LAGPEVFLPDAIDVGRHNRELCQRHGLIGLYPLNNTVNLAGKDALLQIFRGNETMMNQADAIIANLTRFRRPGADSFEAFVRLAALHLAAPNPRALG